MFKIENCVSGVQYSKCDENVMLGLMPMRNRHAKYALQQCNNVITQMGVVLVM